MLRPEDYAHLTDGVDNVASMLHENIVQRIVERVMLRLDRGDDSYLTAIDKWQLETLEQAGYLREDLEREVAARTGVMLREMAEAFESAGVRALAWDDEVYKAAGLEPAPLKQSPMLMRLMERAYNKTSGEFKNLTGTMAGAGQRLFIAETDKAYHLVSSGAASYTGAIREAIDTIARDGVTVTYPSGHTDTVETATFRAVRTGVGQACGEISLNRMEELGWDIVLTSAHIGARTGDGMDDWTNHAWWQGRFFSLSGQDRRFPRFDVCGYGMADGIFGINCRHSVGPGDGENNPWEKYDTEENRAREEQDRRQRLLERRIRATRREVMARKAAIDSAKTDAARDALQAPYRQAAQKLRRQNAEYNRFCEEHGVQKFTERLHVAGWNRQQAAAASGAARRKTDVANGGGRGIIGTAGKPEAEAYFSEIVAHPKSLGSHTPEGLKTALEQHGATVTPLTQGKLKGVSFEEGGGFKANFSDGGLIMYHPNQKSHHGGAYYKISTGKGGTKRYDIHGDEKTD